ncbi:MAG: hypothetical protein AAF992_16455 [Bacteroidota bacterium]
MAEATTEVATTYFAFPQTWFWCTGRVTLENDVVLEGDISYDLKFEALQVKTGNVTRTFTAENITVFEMFDPIKYRHRKYVAVDHIMDEGYKRKTFFEVLADGEITILRKSRYLRRPRITEDFRAPHIYLNAVCRHTYYIYQGEQFAEIEDFKSQVLPLMQSHRKKVDDYVRRCELKLQEIHEQMRVVILYNQLVLEERNDKLLSESLGDE